jgi:hypothetical protein
MSCQTYGALLAAYRGAVSLFTNAAHNTQGAAVTMVGWQPKKSRRFGTEVQRRQ